MSLPLVSCCCLTYGRIDRLQEALACFLAQDYAGPKELVILNSLPDQTLSFSHPEVRIVNLPKRPLNLGATRNLAVSECRGEIILPYDDDDIYLPQFIRAHEFRAEDQWVQVVPAWQSHGGKLKGVARGGFPIQVGFRKKAWEQIGGYPQKNSGEDQDFRDSLNKLPGRRIEGSSWQAVFGYGWGNGVWHISGAGEDRPGQSTGWEKSELNIKRGISEGRIPRGKIDLQPVVRDWQAQADRLNTASASDLLVVLNVVDRDFEQAQDLLRWQNDLGASRKFPLLLASNRTANLDALEAIAASSFSVVGKFLYEENEPPIIPGNYSSIVRRQNAGFRLVAREAAKHGLPWLWLESDAVPLKKDWLTTLLQAYKSAGKPFFGPYVAPGHINGLSIYPPNPEWHAPKISEAVFKAWDIIAGPQIVPRAHRANELMPHHWGDTANGVRVNSKQHLESLAPGRAVLFHRCKDGSVLRILRDSVNAPRPHTPRLRNLPVNASIRPAGPKEAPGFNAASGPNVAPGPNAASGTKAAPAAKLAHAFVQLGRFGDIINILPLLKWHADQAGAPVHLVVAETYLDVVSGVSYVRGHGFPGAFEDLHLGEAWALERFERITTTQVYGRKLVYGRVAGSFCKEAWARAGHLDKFGTLPLVFDRRDPVREEQLWQRTMREQRGRPDRPTILISLGGFSSPFPHADALWNRMQRKFAASCNVIDLRRVKAAAIFDLLGLFDRAAALVAIDTATLHLARASEVPLIALITDGPTPWHGSVPKKEAKLSLKYGEYLGRAQEVDLVLEGLVGQGRAADFGQIQFPAPHRDSRKEFVLTYSEYSSTNPETNRRNLLARKTRDSIQLTCPNWKILPVQDNQLPRLFQDSTGRFLPYVRDLIHRGLAGMQDSDYLVITNTDTCLGEDLPDRIGQLRQNNQPGAMHRRDFGRLLNPLSPREVRKGASYCGWDLFAFSKQWWGEFGKEFPDMLLGAEAWDALLARLILSHGGVELDGFIYHERHASVWEDSRNRTTSLSQRHNRKLAVEFLRKRGINPATIGIVGV